MHARAVHNQRAGGGIEEVIAYAETLARAPGVGRIVADRKGRVQRARTRVEPDIGLQVSGVHVYSHAG